jgi:hypothetical protein
VLTRDEDSADIDICEGEVQEVLTQDLSSCRAVEEVELKLCPFAQDATLRCVGAQP